MSSEIAHTNGTNGTDAASSNVNIRAMSEGRQFVSFTNNNDKDTITKSDVFVFYEPEGKLGTLFWCEPGKREKDATRSLLLHQISDVFLGKQTTELKSKEAADVPSDRCFSIIAKERALHLCADTPDVRNSWLAGIKDVFTLSAQAKKAKAAADKDKKPAAAAAGNGTAANGTAAAAAAATPATTAASSTTPAPATAAAPAATVAAPAAAAASSSSTTTPAASSGSSAVDQMRAGSSFVGFFGTSPTVRKNITVWLDSTQGRLGALHWSESSDKKPVDDQLLMLHKISDVFLGKQSAELKQSDAPANQCFSIVTSKPSTADASKPPAVLHLQAESEAVRTAWLAGIKEVFTTSGKKDTKKPAATAAATAAAPAATAASNNTTPAAATPAPTAASVPAATAAAAAVVAPVVAAATDSGRHTGPVVTMAAGTSFTGYFAGGEGGAVEKKSIYAFYDDGEGTGKLGSIYWTTNQGKKEKDATRQIPLHKISDVYLGKQSSELKSNAEAPSSSCFSIITKDRSLHLQADAEPTRTTWLNGIKQLFASNGKKVDDAKKKTADAAAPIAAAAATAATVAAAVPAAAESTKQQITKDAPKTDDIAKFVTNSAATAIAPVVAAATPAPAADSSVTPNVAAIIAGTSFTAFFDKENPTGAAKNPKNTDPAIAAQAAQRTIVKRTIFVWYEKEDGKLGSLHYNTEGKRQKQAVNIAVPLHKISDVFMGKQTIELKSAVAADSPSSSCFAIITSVQQLHLVADNEATRTQWLGAIKDVFASSGKKVDDANKKKAEDKPVESAVATANNVATQAAAAASTLSAAATPAAAPAATKEESDVAAMVTGDVFTAFLGKENTVAKPIVLFLDRSQAKLGTLFWNEDTSSREQNAERALVLHRISDVYLGKQSPELKSPAAASAAANTCFAIITKDRSLHLQAKSEAQRTQWLNSIKYIFSSAGKKVDDANKKDVTAAPVAAATAAVASVPAAAAGASTLTSTSNNVSNTVAAPTAAAAAAASNVESMKAGRTMTGFFTNKETQTISSKKVLLWYEDTDAGKLGSLYWNEPGSKQRVEAQVIPLHKISDVYIGKQTAELKSPGAASFDNKHCFSILTKTSGLHLVAESEAERNLWLGGVKEIFATGNKVVQQDEKNKKPATTTTAASVPPAASLEKPKPEDEARRASMALIEPLTAGHHLEGFFGTEKGAVKKPLFVFLEPSNKAGKLGTLYWTESKQREMIVENSIPLDKISDVYAGKRTPALQAPEAADYNAKRCWSIVSKERAIHLAAPTEQVRSDWMNGLKAALNKDNAIAVETRPVTDNTVAKLSASDHVEYITKGHQITQYVAEGTNVVKKSSFLYYVAQDGKYGTLYLSPSASQRDQRDEKTSIPLQSITDVWSGKKTTELKSATASSALPVNCFSIVSKKTALHVETESQTQATAWMDGIKAAFTTKGKSVKENAKPTTSSSSSSILTSGRPFIGYFGSPESVTVKNINIYLEPSEGRLGTFYYYDASQQRSKIDENSVPLHKISDVYLGKQTKILLSSSVTGSSDTCFTIVTKKMTLNLQAPNAQARTEFTTALHAVFTNSGKKVVEDDTPRKPAAVDVSAPVTKVEPFEVTSPYGLGTVDEAPRTDGIVPVKLPWSTAYMHQSSIDRVRTVHTTMGTGRMTGPARTDGIIPVELPFGVAYMHEESVDKDSRKLVLKDGRTVHLLGPLTDGHYKVRLDNGAISTITKDEIQEDQQGLTSPTSASKLTRDDSTRILKQGATFTSFTTPTATPTQIDLFLDENEGKLGTLYAAAVGSREKDANKALPLHRITDLFLGKQTAALQGSSASSTPDSRCFSIISKVHKVDVAADSEKTRNNWLYAIHGILTSSGRKVIEEKVPSSTPRTETKTSSSSNTLAAPAERPRRYSVTKPELPTVEAATGILTAGSSFYTFIKSTGTEYLRRPTFAYLDPSIGKLGAIILSDDGAKHRSAAADHTYKLDEMRDIYLGKRTPALASNVAKTVSSDHTFSVLLKDKRSLDLEAPNKEIREKWFFGLYSILSASQKKVVRKDSTQPQAIATAATAAVAANSAATSATKAPAPLPAGTIGAVLTSGQRFLIHRGDISKSTSQPGYLYYDESSGKLGSIVLSNTDSYPSHPEISIPLDRISDVFLGKQTAALKSPETKDIPVSHCFALVTSQNLLNLQANSEAERTAWLNDFKALFSKRAAEVKAKKAQEKADRAKNGIASPRAVDPKAEADDALLASMKAGRNFISYSAEPSKQQVLVWFVPEDGRFGTLYWSTTNEKKRIDKQSLSLHRITDMYLGKQTPIFQMKEHAAAFSIRCMSIVSKKTQLHLEAESREERDAWLNKINQILQTSGKRVVDKEKPSYERPSTLPTVPKDLMAKMTLRRPSILAIPPHGTVRMMEHGSVFTRHQVNEPAQKITVFYQSDSKLGTLFWYTGRDRVARTSQSLPLNQVTDVMLGKQTPAFKLAAANNVNEVLCFALLGVNQTSLELEAESTEQLTAWLFGVNSLLTTSGRKIVLEEPTTGEGVVAADKSRDSTLHVATHAPRRYSVMASDLSTLAPASQQGEGETAMVENKSSLESTHISLPSDITTRIITKGTNFTYFTATQDKREVFLFYEAAPGGALGSIYWSAPNTRVKNTSDSMDLLDISRVYVGKAPAILRGAEQSDPDRFVTFTTKDSSNYSFEARSEESLSAWLQSINTLLINMAFKKVQLDTTGGDENTVSRSFVVVDPAQPANDQPQAFTHFAGEADAEKEHKFSGSAITDEDTTLYDSPERLQAVISQGATFTGYSSKGKRIIVRKIHVFYDKDSDGDQYLYWSEPGSRIPDVDNAMDLDEIKDVSIGTPVLAKVDDNNRVVLIKGEQLTLELVAETKFTAKAFAEAIKILIKNHGQL